MLADDIATYLQTQGVGTIGTDIFKSYLPESPDSLLAIYETGGSAPNPDIPTRSPTFQIYIRNASYSTGRTKLEAVRAALHQLANQTLGSTYFYYILAIAEGGHLGRDDNGRDLFSINFRCITR